MRIAFDLLSGIFDLRQVQSAWTQLAVEWVDESMLIYHGEKGGGGKGKREWQKEKKRQQVAGKQVALQESNLFLLATIDWLPQLEKNAEKERTREREIEIEGREKLKAKPNIAVLTH